MRSLAVPRMGEEVRMIERKLFYFVECDGCGSSLKRENYYITHHEKRSETIDDLKSAEWVKKGLEWFCPECQEKGFA